MDSSGLPEGPPHVLRAYGRTIGSFIPLPELPPANPASLGDADWLITDSAHFRLPPCRWSVLWRTTRHEVWTSTADGGDCRYFRFKTFADFRVSRGRIGVCRRAFTQPHTLRHLLLDQVMPLALAAEGEVVLHAAVVHTAAGAIILSGPGGAGKSTLAGALAQQGHAVLADDAARLTMDRPLAVFPSYPGLRIWPEPSKPHIAAGADRVAEYTSKVRVPPAGAWADAPVPVAGVYAVVPGDVLAFAPLGGAGAIRWLMEHMFRCAVDEREPLRLGLDAAAQVAAAVPLWIVRVPRDLRRIGEVAQAVADHAANLASRGGGTLPA